MTVSVPGNLLLLGEYAVLEEGGLGIALAVDRRIWIALLPGTGLSVEGSWPGGGFAWTPRETRASPLVTAAVDGVQRWLQESGSARPAWAARISVDSTELFGPDGRKRGLGASAAVCVGLVAALLEAADTRDERARGIIPRLAARAHREAQGGRGSGYDVVCSFYGGMGLFRGGAVPDWQSCRLPWDARIFLFPGPSAVSTTDAVQRYALWKERNPRAAREFLQDSNHCVREFLRASSAEAALSRLRACRKLGIAVGDAIGVTSRIDAPPGLDPAWCKALGAGNELGGCIIPSDIAPPEDGRAFERARVSERGISWEG
jgi:phosphomevalonate kinase